MWKLSPEKYRKIDDFSKKITIFIATSTIFISIFLDLYKKIGFFWYIFIILASLAPYLIIYNLGIRGYLYSRYRKEILEKNTNLPNSIK